MKNLIRLALVLIPLLSLSPRIFAENWNTNTIFKTLDYGLYWYDSNDNAQKAIAGQSNAYYNKNNKTIIYVHGWQNGTVNNTFRESFNFNDIGGPSHNLAGAWRNAGYNVGILYWNQFADEGEVAHAEAKIWTKNGPQNMRYKVYTNGSSNVYENYTGSKNAAELVYDEIKGFMGSNFNGSELRIAGHSLGNQMALAVSDLIRKDVDAGRVTSKLLPKRIALLDPFYSNGSKSYLGGDWAGERARWAANSLISDGVAVEVYRSSAATSTIFIGDENKSLMNKTAFTELKPWYFSAWKLKEKHVAAVWHYFWSFNFAPPSIKNSSAQGASASVSNSRIKSLMSSSKKLVHDLGAYTIDPNDDRFKYVNR
jgi:hypothetical protein